MDCNKCGTPILPGEHVCRFCGAIDDFSERKAVEAPVEVIDFESLEEEFGYNNHEVIDFDNDAEVIDFMLGLDDISLEDPKDEVVNIDENYEYDGGVTIVTDAFDEPATSRIPVEEVKEVMEKEKSIQEPVIVDEPVAIDEPVNIDNEVKEENKEEIKEEKVEEDKVEKDEDKSSPIAIIILVFLLVLSLVANVYLVVIKKQAPAKEEKPVETSKVLSSAVYSNYRIDIPSNWNVDSSNNDYLLLFDETNKWAASINFLSNVNYKMDKDSAAKLTSSFGGAKYLFTSDYEKTVNGKEFHIFKGKYYSYNVYVIFNKVSDTLLTVADLKFVEEPKEDIIDGLLTSLSTVKLNDMTSILKDNFEFKNVATVVEGVLPKESK